MLFFYELDYFTFFNLICKIKRVLVTTGKFGSTKALASSVYKVKKTSILYKTIILIFEQTGVYYNRTIT